MKQMIQSIGVIFFTLMANSNLMAGNGVCFHCQEIREHNRLHPQNYEYYEDYLKEKQDSPDGSDTADASKSQHPKDESVSSPVKQEDKPVR